jgi:hypothetical protein
MLSCRGADSVIARQRTLRLGVAAILLVTSLVAACQPLEGVSSSGNEEAVAVEEPMIEEPMIEEEVVVMEPPPEPAPARPPPPAPPQAVEEAAPQVAMPEFAAPQFPWPPPQASAMTIIPAAFVRPNDIADPTLGDVADRISAALDSAGYFERSYFAAPGGFAMVTRLERINSDGTPKQDEAERWTVDASPMRRFVPGDYLLALFTAPSGYYRIIVFVASSQPFAQSEAEVGRSEASAWLSAGLNTLPESIAQAEYTARHRVTALIYEFEQPGRQAATLRLPGNLLGRVHLQRALVWDAFSQ